MGEKPNFSGKYELEGSENLDAFMIANVAKPDLEVVQEGDNKFTWTTISSFYTNFSTFIIDEPIEEKQANGEVMKVTLTWDGDTLVSLYEPVNPEKGKKQRATRELRGDKLVFTLYIDDVVAKRYYRRKI